MDYFNLVLSNLSCGFHCRYITQWTFLKEILLKLYSEAYLDPYQKSTEEYFVKIGNGFQLLAMFTGNFILDVWRVSKHTSGTLFRIHHQKGAKTSRCKYQTDVPNWRYDVTKTFFLEVVASLLSCQFWYESSNYDMKL